ncbi:XkdX family protein [Microbacterium sp. NPDC096154]
MWFATVKRYYDNGHPAYTADAVKVFVKAKMITAKEYKQITNVDYAE